VEDYLLFVEHVRANLEPRPCFLLGRGMGATIAIQVMRAFVDIEEERKREAASRLASRMTSPEAANRQLRSATTQPSASAPLSIPASSASPLSPSASLNATANLSGLSLQRPSSPRDVDDSDARAAQWHWHGCVLISPAIIPPASVSPLQEMFAHLFYDLLPKLGGSIFSFSVLDDSALSRIPSVVAQWQADPLVFKTPMLARWAVETLQTMNELREDSHTITFPFLICQGTEDRFVSPAGADWLYRRSQSRDKKLKKYRGGYHDLLHDVNRDSVFEDILRWCDERV
jgi:alpha-beta hydrolase superfamily lysophospholipase